MFTYRCCYCQVSHMLSVHLSWGHSTAKNALLGRPCSALDKEVENRIWLSRGAGWRVNSQTVQCTWAVIQLHPEQSGATTSHDGSSPYPSVPRTWRTPTGSCSEKEESFIVVLYPWTFIKHTNNPPVTRLVYTTTIQCTQNLRASAI